VSVSRDGAAPITYGTVESLVVDATAYYDDFYVHSTAAGTAVTIREGAGGDIVLVGSDPAHAFSSTLDQIQGPLTLDGGEGGSMDRLDLIDQGNAIGHTYTVTATGVSRSGMAPITYSSYEDLVMEAGGASDVVNVRSTAAGTPVGIFLGAGDDTANVGNSSLFVSNTLGGIQGSLEVGGQGGTDVVNLNDQQVGTFANPSAPGQYTVSSGPYIFGTRVERSGAARFESDAERIVLNTSGIDDAIQVSPPPAGQALTVNAGAGADTIVVLPSNGAPFGPVTVNGQDGTDTLDDSNFLTGVRVNLALGTATNLAGVSGVENVLGGAGADILIGDANANVLRGNGGRDLLIGREGVDQLLGDAGEDILIGNPTVLDANAAALEAVMAEWSRTDLAYGLRIQHLKLGGGNNGAVVLNVAKVVEDAAPDFATGGTDSDWFLGSGGDIFPDFVLDTERIN
jgi:Ca2+-binding RTX toxin-like protein